jgi:hypothetical protein
LGLWVMKLAVATVTARILNRCVSNTTITDSFVTCHFLFAGYFTSYGVSLHNIYLPNKIVENWFLNYITILLTAQVV